MQQFILIIVVVASIGLAVIALIGEVWRKKKRGLKQEFEKERASTNKHILNLKNRQDELEVDLMVKSMLLEGLEELLAKGWTVVYSHSCGICCKREGDENCLTLEDAVITHAFGEAPKGKEL